MKFFDKTKVSEPTGDIGRNPKITVVVDGAPLSDDYHLLSQAGSGAADVQIDKTFDDTILVTPFGQKMLPMTIKGLSIPAENRCAGGGGKSLATLYKENHAGAKRTDGKVSLVKISWDDNVFEGVLVGIQQQPYTLSDGANMDIFIYTLIIHGRYK